MNILLKALRTASVAHKFQMRKDGVTPFINHPIQVAELISSVGGIQNEDILSAAILHDIIEDTTTSDTLLRDMFGAKIADIVLECSDDKSLSKKERKRLQVATVSKKSYEAKIIKLADKIANMSDILINPATGWDLERKLAYFEWSKEVIDAGLRGINSELEYKFDKVYQQKELLLEE